MKRLISIAALWKQLLIERLRNAHNVEEVAVLAVVAFVLAFVLIAHAIVKVGNAGKLSDGSPSAVRTAVHRCQRTLRCTFGAKFQIRVAR